MHDLGWIWWAVQCVTGFHRWGWYDLHDHDLRKAPFRVSQCTRCRTIQGGWRGRRDHFAPDDLCEPHS